MLRQPARWKRPLPCVARASCPRVRAASLPPEASFQTSSRSPDIRRNLRFLDIRHSAPVTGAIESAGYPAP